MFIVDFVIAEFQNLKHQNSVNFMKSTFIKESIVYFKKFLVKIKQGVNMWNSKILFVEGGNKVLVFNGKNFISMSYKTYLETFKM